MNFYNIFGYIRGSQVPAGFKFGVRFIGFSCLLGPKSALLDTYGIGILKKLFSEIGTYEQINKAGFDPKNFDGKASKRFFGGWSIPSFSSLPSLPDIGNGDKMKALEGEVEDLEAKNDLMKNEIVSA